MGVIKNTLSKGYYSFNLWRKYQFTLGKRLDWFQSNEHKSRSELDQIRQDLLQRLINQAALHSPYYRQLFRTMGIKPGDIQTESDLARLPLLTKTNLRQNLKELVCDNVRSEDLKRDATGGSTGVPTPYYHDREYECQRAALDFRNWEWTGWLLGEPRVRIWGSSFDVKMQTQIRNQITNWLSNITYLPAFDMSTEQIAGWMNIFQKRKPTILEGYMNALVTFAHYALENNIALGDIGLKGVVSAAETLYPEKRQMLERFFECKVFNRYGSRELSAVAHECAYGRIHVNEDWVQVEIVDDVGQPVPRGQLGQIVLTGYFNYGTPFIRYAVEDVGSFSAQDEPCPCGCTFRTLDRVEGRIQDLIVLPKGGFVSGIFFPHLFKDYDIKQFQVIQNTIEELEILLIPGNKLHESDLAHLQEKISTYLPGIKISMRLIDQIALSSSGKFRSVISKVATSTAFKHEDVYPKIETSGR